MDGLTLGDLMTMADAVDRLSGPVRFADMAGRRPVPTYPDRTWME